jgi:hypothetical protein
MMKNNAKGQKMTGYAIYQLPEEHKNIRDLYFMEASEIEAISDSYELVCFVKARTLDEVFRIGNFIVESDEQYRTPVKEMHSLSVGDIVHNLETNETWVCAGYGWDKIDMKEAA